MVCPMRFPLALLSASVALVVLLFTNWSDQKKDTAKNQQVGGPPCMHEACLLFTTSERCLM
jgi:hypothetical protein